MNGRIHVLARLRFRHKLSDWHEEIAAWAASRPVPDFPENKSSAAD